MTIKSSRFLLLIMTVGFVISTMVAAKYFHPVVINELPEDSATLSWKIEAITEEICELNQERDELIQRQIELLREGR